MLNSFLYSLLNEYKQSVIIYGKSCLKPNMKEKIVTYNNEKFLAKYNNEHYLLYDNNHLFYGGNVDDNDFDSTFKNDFETYGLVILALAHLDNNHYLKSLSKDKIIALFTQLEYVLGFCRVLLPDGREVKFKDLMDEIKIEE